MNMDHCRIVDLRGKEVINICDGARLGFPCDVEIDMVTGQLVAIVVPGPNRFFGLFGHTEDYVVPWCQIKRIGEDTILVEYMAEPIPPPPPRERRRRYW
jgi:YlmC/YmxH family sporulation protein